MPPEEIGLKSIFDTSEFSKGLDTYLSGLKQATGATTDAGRAISGLSPSASQAGAGIGGLDAALMGAVSGGVSAIVTAVGTLAVNAFNSVTDAIGDAAQAVIGFGVSSIKVAGEVDQLQRIALFLGLRAGETREGVLSALQAVEEMGIRADVAARLLSTLSRNYIDVSKSTEFATLAQNLAKVAMKDSSEVLETLTNAALTSNVLMARRAELIVDFTSAQDEFAASTGRTRQQLSANEIVLANMNALIEEGQKLTGVYAVAQGSATASVKSLGRQIFNLQAAIGAPFQEAWFNLVTLARDAVEAIDGLVSEGGALQPVLVNLGAAAALVTEAFADLVRKGIDFVTNLATAWTDGLSGIVEVSARGGVEIVAGLAEGIVTAASTILVQAMNFVSAILTSWLAPGSPPKVAPDIDEWGAETMNEYLRGFTEADFGILKGLQSILRSILSGPEFAAVSEDIAAAISAGADEAFFERLARSTGKFGDEIAELARRQFALAEATEAAVRANEDFAAAQTEVDEQVEEYNRLLREGATEEQLAQQLALVRAAEAQEAAAAEQVATTGQNIDELESEAALQEELVRQLIALSQARDQAAAAGVGGAAGAAAAAGAAGAVGAITPELDLPEISADDITTQIGEAIDEAKERLRGKFAELFQPLQEAIDGIKGQAGGLRTAFDTFATSISDSWAAIVEAADVAMAWYEKNVAPAVETLSDLIGTLLVGALEVAAATWENVLAPVMEEAASFAETSLIPLFTAFGELMEAIVAKGLEAATGALETLLAGAQEINDWLKANLIPLLEDFGETLLPIIREGFDAIAAAVQWVTDGLKGMADIIRNMTLPDWLEPGSPPPLFFALMDIGDAVDRLALVEIPRLNRAFESVSVPVLEPAMMMGGDAGQTTFSAEANFNVGNINTPMDQAAFEAMANRWWGAKLREAR